MGVYAEKDGLLKEAENWFIESFYQGYLLAYFKLGDFYKEHNLKESNVYHMMEQIDLERGQFKEAKKKYDEMQENQKQIISPIGDSQSGNRSENLETKNTQKMENEKISSSCQKTFS